MAKKNMSREDQHKQQDVEIKETLRQIKNKILVMSGKGGVGKSMVQVYLGCLVWKEALDQVPGRESPTLSGTFQIWK